MHISLCSQLFDYAGAHVLRLDAAGSDLSPLSRRLSRTATLDGGALLIDNGYCVADATFTLSIAELSFLQRQALLDTLANHSLLSLSCRLGCFLGAVERVDESRGLSIRFLVLQSLTE